MSRSHVHTGCLWTYSCVVLSISSLLDAIRIWPCSSSPTSRSVISVRVPDGLGPALPISFYQLFGFLCSCALPRFLWHERVEKSTLHHLNRLLWRAIPWNGLRGERPELGHLTTLGFGSRKSRRWAGNSGEAPSLLCEGESWASAPASALFQFAFSYVTDVRLVVWCPKFLRFLGFGGRVINILGRLRIPTLQVVGRRRKVTTVFQ